MISDFKKGKINDAMRPFNEDFYLIKSMLTGR